MSGELLSVSIVEDGSAGKCDARCGVDWSLDENRQAAQKEIRARFGQRVGLSFYDMAAPTECRVPADIVDRVLSKSIAAPLLVIDGELRIAGYFDIRMMCDTIQAALEMRGE